MRWGENETHTFVKLYLSHNCLWNPRNVDYKSLIKRKEAYQQIITQFCARTRIRLIEAEVRQKIRSLRSTYFGEKVKIKQRAATSSPYQSKLRWFADFHRCFVYLKRAPKAEYSIENEKPTDDSTQIWINNSYENDNINNEADNGDSDQDPFVTADDENLTILKIESEDTEIKNQFQMRKRKVMQYSPIPDASKNLKRDLTNTIVVPEPGREDEFDIYGKYIATQLRGMGLERALKVQLMIQNIVSEERLEHLSSLQNLT